MKNVFGMKVTKGEQSSSFDGAIFITKRLDEEKQETMDQVSEETENQLAKLGLSFPAKLTKYICFGIGMIILAALLRADVSFAEAFRNVPWLFYLGGIAFVIAGFLQIMEWKIRKKHMNSEEFSEHLEKAEQTVGEAKRVLGIPENAFDVDILSFLYKEKKNGKIVSALPSNYVALDMYVYADEESLYIADCSAVFSFPRKALGEFELRKKRISINEWNKEDGYNSKQYREYKLTEDNMGNIWMKKCYALTVSAEEEAYELLIPPYDVQTVADLIEKSLPEEE